MVELPSRKTEVITRWGKPGNIETRGIALDPNGSRVWIAVADPDQGVLKLDLTSGQLERASIPGLTGFAIIGDRILYTHGTRLQEFKGAFDVDLPAGFSGEEGHRRVLVAP